MSRTYLRPVADVCRSVLRSFALVSPLLIRSPAFSASPADSATSVAVQSDDAAVQAMKNVMVQSGGEAAWTSLRSAKESFSIKEPSQKIPQVLLLLDDWSLDTTRYRRRVQGQSSPPSDHNGSPTFPVDAGTSKAVVPEFDQARVLVGRLPAAAAEIMLRRHEYVLKMAKTQQCKSTEICIDVFRKTTTSPLTPSPEQQWKISTSTGLPVTVRYQTATVGSVGAPTWREVYFLQYAPKDGLIVPIAIGMILRGQQQTWILVSLTQSPGFDISKFDQEAGQ
jgi:hypothetical protein